MADRLTQLQGAVNQLADYFCNSIGVLQQTHDSSNNDDEGKDTSTPNLDDNISLFATLITRTAADIDILIDSLPSQEYTPDKQVEMLKKLELENNHFADKLTQTVTEAESLLINLRETNKQVSSLSLSLSNQS